MFLRKWHLKAVVQKTISVLPQSQRLNYVFQKYVTKGLTLTDDLFFDRYGHAVEHIKAFEQYKRTSRPIDSCLELGTGWYPIVPFTMFLYGANQIVTTDIDQLCTSEQCIALAQMFIKQYDAGKLNQVEYVPARFELLRAVASLPNHTPLSEVLHNLHMQYKIVDLSQPVDLGTFDLVTSNNTFEHVYPQVLEPILRNLQNATAQGGVMSHFIDLSDHYAHMDGSINIYNFLRYSDAQWQWIDNSVQPMNRWRMPDYRRLYYQLNIGIAAESVRPGDIGQLRTVPVDAQFGGNTEAENAISHAYVFSIK